MTVGDAGKTGSVGPQGPPGPPGVKGQRGLGLSGVNYVYQVFYFCNPPCFTKPVGKAADTIAQRSKSSRQLKQKFSHTRKTPKNDAVDNY